MKSESISHIAITVMCMLVAAVALRTLVYGQLPAQATAAARSAPSSKPIAKGTDLSRPLEGVKLGSESTAIIVVSSQCQFCVNSMPFYKALSTLPQMDGKRQRLVVYAYDDLPAVEQLVREAGLRTHGIYSFPKRNVIEIQGTPTVFVVDKNGKVKDSWTGQLPKNVEAEVVAALLR